MEIQSPIRKLAKSASVILRLVPIWILIFAFLILKANLVGDEVNFSRDILPILSDRCFHCHGPDETHREADLRLDIEADAKLDWGDGKGPIRPHDLLNSEIWQRIITDDPDLVMPPPDSHRKPISDAERSKIRLWIKAGAKWGKHWSFEPPIQVPLKEPSANPIDVFVRQKLSENNLSLSPPAETSKRLRRLYFALTGLSPSQSAIQSFEKNPTAEVWEQNIDRIFQSDRYAERMAMWWLDAARYSDSDGYQQDQTRENWPWRDWVISSFRKNLPFDEFTRQQFAGDLLPDATPEQILATCFHRNHMTNGEGGRDPEESRIDYVIDRVNTTGTVWMGLTLGCTQCHSHKFDPISQQDYYSMAAFFDSIDEDGKAGFNAKPYLKYQSDLVQPRIAELNQFVKRCKSELEAEKKLSRSRFDQWLTTQADLHQTGYTTWQNLPPNVESSSGSSFHIDQDQVVHVIDGDPFHDDYRVSFVVKESLTQLAGWKIEVFPDQSHVNERFTRGGTGDFTLTGVRLLVQRAGSPAETEIELSKAIANFESDPKRKSDWDTRYSKIAKTLNDDARDGWTTQGSPKIRKQIGVFELSQIEALNQGDRVVIVLRHGSTHGHANIGKFRISLTQEPGETIKNVVDRSPIKDLAQFLVNHPISDVQGKLRERLFNQYVIEDSVYQEVLNRYRQANSQLGQLKKQLEPRRVMVLCEREKKRTTHVLVRGVWDAKGEPVSTGVIPSVLDWPAESTKNRLDLANWLTDRKNPLTARVIVNHLWQIMFGTGLVRTPEDFGLQGEFPTHPELLDWLAVELMENDWDIQHILRLIANSKTFQQSSHSDRTSREMDPKNQLYSRAPKFRLPAWMLRDNALKVSGLLNDAVGGPPVSPYQPDGVWSEITMGRFRYRASLGPAQYRRTLYAFWRRSSAPSFLFDNATRRVCEVNVRQTNTPLHALTIMNDTTMLEAARVLADRAVSGSEINPIQLIAQAVLSRKLDPNELQPIERVIDRVRSHYASRPDDAAQLIKVGQQSVPRDRDKTVEIAVWMTVANLILNLDEAISYE